MTYNIPGVFTSVIDRSYIQPLIVEGRSVLIAGFSKYGEDKFYNFADADTMKFSLGDMDIKRYGLGLMYGLDSLTKTRNVIFKRLLPDDATFANLLFKTNSTTETWPDIIDTDTIKEFLDADQGLTLPPLVPQELEIKAIDGQTSVFTEYNPLNVVVYLNGLELPFSEYNAVNGQQIIFDSTLTADKIINIYTVIDNIPQGEPGVQWVNEEHIEQSLLTPNTITVPGGYDPANVWVTRNGIELFNAEFNATDGTTIDFVTGLSQGEIIKIHGVIDATGYGNDFRIQEMVVSQDGATAISTPIEYNPSFTLLTIEGVILGKDDYRADDGFNIYFSSPLQSGQTIRLHSITAGDFSHYYGSLFAKAAGAGYNDLYIRFQPATDVERFYSDEEGDPRYKFNFLAATVFEQTVNGQKKVSNSFIISLIDEDPESLMPIISNVTGESLFINDKFSDSNEFVDFYMNESFLPEFKKNLNIDTLTQDSLGTPGANRLILKNSVYSVPPGGNTPVASYRNNIELVVNGAEAFEKKSTVIEGKEVIYTYFNDPNTGDQLVVGIRAIDGKLYINQEGTAGTPTYPLFIDGINSYYTSYITPNPNYLNPTSGDTIFGSDSMYMIDNLVYKTLRQDFYNQLVGSTVQTSLWQLQSGSNGLNLIRGDRLNMGYSPGDLFSQDAKQLLIEFYNNDETVHEVLYPELDFDYVPDWTQDIDVMNSIVQFADEIGFTMPIISLPRQTDYESDYLSRIEDVYLSSYNTMLYSGQNNDNHYMAELGLRITAPASYYALLNHLNIDEQISITEPMANIVKGQLPVAGAQLSYIAKSAHIEKLRSAQINTIIKEIDGIYFIDQLTAYKSASKLSRGNVVKVIHRMRKDLPKILKDLLQRKALENVLASAKSRTEKYMARWLVTDNNTTDGIFSEIEVTPLFIEEELKLIVSIAVKPIGTIEKIEVPITVY